MKKILPRIICVVGPTASGKTDLGIELGLRFHGEIINADSRQLYRGFRIGTGMPEEGIVAKSRGRRTFFVRDVPHYLMDAIPPTAIFSVTEWREKALRAIKGIIRRGHIPIIVGGTGLYIRSLVDNFQFPEIPPNPSFRAALETKTLPELVTLLLKLDPEAEQVVDLKNPRRIIRALEVITYTGQPFSKQKTTGEPIFDALQIGIEWPREELYARNDRAVENMLQRGWLEEIKTAVKKGVPETAPAMTSIGYRELLQAIRGEREMDEAVDATKKAVRHYAKRQLTWFRRDPRIHWVKTQAEAIKLVKHWLPE